MTIDAEVLSELYTIMKQEALDKILEIMATDSSQALAAAKYIASKEFEPKSPHSRGRPSKEEISGAIKTAVSQLTKTEDDYKRMTGLTVISGGKKT